MTSLHYAPARGDRNRPWPPSHWALWREGWLAASYIVGVIAVAVGLGIYFVLQTRFQPGHLLALAVFLLCAAVCIEGMRRLGELTGLVRELLLAWVLPVVLLLPPAYVFLFQLALALLLQARVSRGYFYRGVFTNSAKALAGMVASAVFHLALPGRLWLGNAEWMTRLEITLPVALGAAALCFAIGEMLVDLALKLTAKDSTGGSLWDRESLTIDLAELCVGLLVAVGAAVALPLALLAVPPVLFMQRSLTHAQLRMAARTDAKTGLLNSGAWQREAESEVARAHRTGASLALLLVDIDHFKRVNDEYGHLLGDQVLIGFAELLGGQLRDYDVLGRFGGEEFIVLLPETDSVEAYRVAERLRAHVGVTSFPCPDGDIDITVSIGVALLRTHGEDLVELIAAADLALYHAKAGGRDLVCLPGGGDLHGSSPAEGRSGRDRSGRLREADGHRVDSVRAGGADGDRPGAEDGSASSGSGDGAGPVRDATGRTTGTAADAAPE